MTTAAFSVGDRVEWLIDVSWCGCREYYPVPMVVAEVASIQKLMLRRPNGTEMIPVHVNEVRRPK